MAYDDGAGGGGLGGGVVRGAVIDDDDMGENGAGCTTGASLYSGTTSQVLARSEAGGSPVS